MQTENQNYVTINVDKFKKIMGTTISIMGAIIVLLICNSLLLASKLNVVEDRVNKENEKLTQANLSIRMRNAELEKILSTSEYGFQTLSNTAVELDAANAELKNTIDSQNKMIQHFKDRVELYNKYEFALFYDNARTDIDYEHIQSLEEMAAEKDYGLDSVVLTLAIVMAESEGNASAKNSLSSASGLGQLLNDTAKFTYENLLSHGEGSYKKEYVFDPEMNLYMTLTYINYLAEENNYNPMKTIDAYRGLHDNDYLKTVQKYLDQAEVGSIMNLRLE